jgi:hypothetical protein
MPTTMLVQPIDPTSPTQSYQNESSGDIKKVVNQPKSAQHRFNIVWTAHTVDNDVELIILVQPPIGNPSLVATGGWPNPLIVLFFQIYMRSYEHGNAMNQQ